MADHIRFGESFDEFRTLKYCTKFSHFDIKWGQFVTDEGGPGDVFGYQGKMATAAQNNWKRRKNITEMKSRLTKNTAKGNY